MIKLILLVVILVLGIGLIAIGQDSGSSLNTFVGGILVGIYVGVTNAR